MEIGWTILLWILKTIGFLIGGLLLLLLFLLLLIICVPIRYQADLERKDLFLYGGRVSWLLKFLQLIYQRTETENIIEIKVGGFCLKREVRPIEKKVKKNKISDPAEDLWETDWQTIEEEEFKQKLFAYLSSQREEKVASDQGKPPTFVETAADDKSFRTDVRPDLFEVVETENDSATEVFRQELQPEAAPETVVQKLDKERIQTVGDWLDSHEAKAGDIWDEFETEIDDEDLSETIKHQKSWREKIDFGWMIFNEIRNYFRQNRGVIKHIWSWVFRMIRSILPRRADGWIDFGLSDPSHTGYILAIFYLFYPEKHGKMVIKPDFEKFIINGQVQIKGRIIIIVLLYYIVRILLDRRIFRLIRLAFQLKKKFADTSEDVGNDDRDRDMPAPAEA
ncbi:DUF2953 domain-containing protein [Clostridiales bacterium COT073_COT-073]|nr:DUF2953 domain-containing protein [Clostridiales bacterium COT073_COT-073]